MASRGLRKSNRRRLRRARPNRSPTPPHNTVAMTKPPRNGVLPRQALAHLIETSRITSIEPIGPAQLQPASLDLRLGTVAFRLQASFLPGKEHSVEEKLQDLIMATVPLTDGATLERNCLYLVPLIEKLHLPASLHGKSNPKSTTGRLDIFTRLLTDKGEEFDTVQPGYHGPLYAEITPRTFTVIARTGDSVNQLRLVRSGQSEISGKSDPQTLAGLLDQTCENAGERAPKRATESISVRLRSQTEGGIIAYRSKKNTPLIDLSKQRHYDPALYWDAIQEQPSGRLILDPGEFYILGSRESLRVPAQYAAEMIAFNPRMGEFRVHYAGFFDPGFGSESPIGTPAVLEVRSHETAMALDHGQSIATIRYDRMSEEPTSTYGTAIGSSYGRQGLTLAKQFSGADHMPTLR